MTTFKCPKCRTRVYIREWSDEELAPLCMTDEIHFGESVPMEEVNK